MKEEFGVDTNGQIRCHFIFPEEMRMFCGKVYQVVGKEEEYEAEPGELRVFLEDENGESPRRNFMDGAFKYSISTDMIEFAEEPVAINNPFLDDELDRLLGI